MKAESASLRRLVGRMLIVGVEGPHLSRLERAWIRLLQPGGVILFRRNIESVDQTRMLLQEVTDASGAPGFRCVDVEGGLVDRLRDVLTPMPSAAAVAATGSRRLWQQHGNLIGLEVRAFGFNTTFAPVLDLALPASAIVMRSRVTSPDPIRVLAYAEAFLKGLHSSSTLGCGKHFPGLGAGTLDSHQATPTISRTWNELWSEDLLPFRKLVKVLPMVMVSHALYPEAGPDRVPASVSKYWVTGILRKRIGYRGLVISDDLEMGGILSHSSIEEAAVAAVLAGTDLIEICRSPELIFRAFEALLSEAERSTAFRRLVEAAARRLTRAKQKLLPAECEAPTARSIASLIEKTKAFAVQVRAGNERAAHD